MTLEDKTNFMNFHKDDFEYDYDINKWFNIEDVKQTIKEFLEFINKSDDFDGYLTGVIEYRLEQVVGKGLMPSDNKDKNK